MASAIRGILLTSRKCGFAVHWPIWGIRLGPHHKRIGQHPASRVAELTPRQWKQRFAAAPLRSALQALVA